MDWLNKGLARADLCKGQAQCRPLHLQHCQSHVQRKWEAGGGVQERGEKGETIREDKNILQGVQEGCIGAGNYREEWYI